MLTRFIQDCLPILQVLTLKSAIQKDQLSMQLIVLSMSRYLKFEPMRKQITLLKFTIILNILAAGVFKIGNIT